MSEKLNKTICELCQINKCTQHHYNMITELIAIGDQFTPYEPFDIIINLNFPCNNVKHNDIVETFSNDKQIYKVGIYDNIYQDIDYVLINLIPKLLEKLNLNKKILFHCWAGASRSASLAISLISKYKKITLLEAYKLAKLKRSRVNQNYHFIEELGKYHNDMTAQDYLFNIFNAIDEGNIKITQELYNRNNTIINMVNQYGSTPLITACDTGQNKIIELLLNLGSTVTQTNNSNPLHVYLTCCDVDEQILDLFIKSGADINWQNEFGCTSLHYAHMNINNKLIKMLLAKGADPNIIDLKGKRPMDYIYN
jgi:predicted protein tyrosine phosphatase